METVADAVQALVQAVVQALVDAAVVEAAIVVVVAADGALRERPRVAGRRCDGFHRLEEVLVDGPQLCLQLVVVLRHLAGTDMTEGITRTRKMRRHVV